jgi:hypothetical protein
MKRPTAILLSIFLLGGCAYGPWKDFYGDPRPASIPRDVRAFVIDAQGCGHFSGEEPYDADRAAFLQKNMDALCRGLPQKRERLLNRYPANKEVESLMAEVGQIFGE